MNSLIFAYIAGALDSDGYFTIRKSTYGMRVTKDCVNPVYSASVGIRQVTPQVPELMKEMFGGTICIQK